MKRALLLRPETKIRGAPHFLEDILLVPSAYPSFAPIVRMFEFSVLFWYMAKSMDLTLELLPA